MKNVLRLLMIVLLIVFAGIQVVPAVAQEGEGGTIVFGWWDDNPPPTFSQVYCQGSVCTAILNLTYIWLIGVAPEMGAYAPNQSGALAESWQFSQDNRVLTMHLRDDMYWSDGIPITSADVMMDYELMLIPEVGHTGAWIAEYIESVEAPDDYTLVFTFHQGSCLSLRYAAGMDVLPSHIYRGLIDEVGYEGLAEHEWFRQPTVTSGPFRFGEMRPDGLFILVGNDDYVDAALEYVNPDEFVWLPVADNDTAMDMLLAGEINVIDSVSVYRRTEVLSAAETGEIQVYEFSGLGWDFMALNWADPTNPQPALGEDGTRIDQGLHPIFGDKLTRQAIARAIDVDAIIEEAVLDFGERMPAHIVSASWAYNHELPPIPYDPELALEMLAEAGWIPENPDAPTGPDNKLICRGCLYATQVDAEFEGLHLEFDLLTQAGNTRRETVAALIRDQLVQIGITIDIQAIELLALADVFSSQTFDALILGFHEGYPQDPEATQLFSAVADDPGFGYSVSFYDEEYFALEEMALNVPGCGLTERADIYWRMQGIMQDELPYIFLYTKVEIYAARNEVEGFTPYPGNLWWNVDTWSVREGD